MMCFDIFIERSRNTGRVIVCVSVPWCISHVGHTAGWWAPWWGRWQTALQGCRVRTQRGPSLMESRNTENSTHRHNTLPNLELRTPFCTTHFTIYLHCLKNDLDLSWTLLACYLCNSVVLKLFPDKNIFNLHPTPSSYTPNSLWEGTQHGRIMLGSHHQQTPRTGWVTELLPY